MFKRTFNLKIPNHATLYTRTIVSPNPPPRIRRRAVTSRRQDRVGARGGVKGGRAMTTIQSFMTEICILLFLSVSNSKLAHLLIAAYAAFTNPIQTNYDSNVAIRTFEACCHFAPPTQTTSLLQTFSNLSSGFFVSEACCHFAPPTAVKLLLPFAFAEMLTCSILTKSKGNFRLIIIYDHKEACCHFAPPKHQISRLSKCPKTTNLFKLSTLFLRATNLLRR
jgi:hypothetical protein